MLRNIFNKTKYVIISIIIIYIITISIYVKNLPQTNPKDDSKPNEFFLENIKDNKTIDIKNNKFIKTTETLEWVEITNYLYVLQAYLDMRKDKYFVRFLVIMKKDIERDIMLTCSFENDSSSIFNAEKYEFNENHAMEFGGYIYSCEIPLRLTKNNEVTIRESKSKGTINIHLKLLKIYESKKFNFTICVPPLHGNINWKSLIAFIEINKILGANHFYFYTYKVESNEINKVFDYYTKNGFLTVKKWNIPQKNIWYNGQMSNIHHCLYENIGISKYTIFQDIDEIMVPLKTNTWNDLMNDMDNGKHCGYKVSSIFMKPLNDPLVYIKSNERYKGINNMRSKCIVKPDLIFEQGIHHISKQNVEEYTPKIADIGKVLLYHFRNCDPMFGFSCSETMNDDRLKILMNNFMLIYNKILVLF